MTSPLVLGISLTILGFVALGIVGYVQQPSWGAASRHAFAERLDAGEWLVWSVAVAAMLVRLLSNVFVARHRARAAAAPTPSPSGVSRRARSATPTWNASLMQWSAAREWTTTDRLGPFLRAAGWYGLAAGVAMALFAVTQRGVVAMTGEPALYAVAVANLVLVGLDTLPMVSVIALFALPAPRAALPAITPGEREQICLLIACHDTCRSTEEANRFEAVLRAALKLFPPGAIFVCDNNSSLRPTDPTEQVVHRVSPEINYLYIPEGNKTFAFYWANRYWVPKVQQARGEQPYRFVMIIDDDVILPEALSLDTSELTDDSKTKAIGYPMRPRGEGRGVNWLQSMQAVEYVLSAISIAFQSRFGTALYAHGSIALWRRDALEEVLLEHNTLFHGEDRYNAFMLFGMKKGFRIKYDTNVFVVTDVPPTFLELWMQRVKSWDLGGYRLCGRVASELCFNWNRDSLILKPFLALHLLTAGLDLFLIFWMIGAIYFVPGLALVGLLFVYAVNVPLVSLVNRRVLRHRPDLRVSPTQMMQYPLYKLLLQLFRIAALLECVVHYLPHVRTPAKIVDRERVLGDIPPCPEDPDPDWHSVYVTDRPAPTREKALVH